MATDEHLRILKGGWKGWQDWRKQHPEITPNLRGANLKGADLVDFDLNGANFQGADLSN